MDDVMVFLVLALLLVALVVLVAVILTVSSQRHGHNVACAVVIL